MNTHAFSSDIVEMAHSHPGGIVVGVRLVVDNTPIGPYYAPVQATLLMRCGSPTVCGLPDYLAACIESRTTHVAMRTYACSADAVVLVWERATRYNDPQALPHIYQELDAMVQRASYMPTPAILPMAPPGPTAPSAPMPTQWGALPPPPPLPLPPSQQQQRQVDMHALQQLVDGIAKVYGDNYNERIALAKKLEDRDREIASLKEELERMKRRGSVRRRW